MELDPDTPSASEPLRGIDSALLFRFISGTGTADDQEAVRRWAALDPRNVAELEALAVMWRAPMDAEAPLDTKAIWRRLGDRVDAAEHASPRYNVLTLEVSPRRRPWTAWIAAAAVVLLVPGAAWQAWTLSRTQPVVGVAAPTREVVTRRGERVALNLPDGSRVILAAASRLRIPEPYPHAGPRDVFLDGEGYFEISHDSARPFRVHAANAVAEDLGTEFVVTAYPETDGIRVVVAAGAVALRTADTIHAQPRASLTLGPRDLGRLDSSGTATVKRNVDLAPYLGWVQGTLIFDATPLRDAIPTLARWYDLDIHLSDSALGDRRLTGTLSRQPAAEALKLLALSLDLEVEQDGKTATLTRKPRQPTKP